MSKPDRDSPDPVPQGLPLEHQQRSLQLVATIVSATVLAALLGFASPHPGVVQAQRVEIVDAKGQVLAALSADTSGTVVTVFGSNGRATASLRFNADPRLSVRDAAGREVAGLGVPRVQHLRE